AVSLRIFNRIPLDLPGHLVHLHLALRTLRDHGDVRTQAVGDLDLTGGEDALVGVRRGPPARAAVIRWFSGFSTRSSCCCPHLRELQRRLTCAGCAALGPFCWPRA